MTATALEVDPAAVGAGRAGLRQWSRTRQAQVLLVVLIVFVLDMVVLVRRALTSDVSLWDEGYHLSYLQYASQWHVPRTGDPMNSWAKEIYTCRPVPPFGGVTALACGDVAAAPEQYPDQARNTAAGWPPIYYFITANAIRPALWLGVEPLIAARVFSALLWAAGCSAIAVLVMRRSNSWVLGVVAGVVGMALPTTWGMSAFVTPYSMTMIISAAVVAALLWANRKSVTARRTAAAGASVGLLSTLILPHSIVVLGVVSLAAVAMAWRVGRRLPLCFLAISMMAAGLIGTLGWERLQAARTAGSGPNQPTYPPEGLKAAFRDNWDNFWPRGVKEFWPPASNDFGAFFNPTDLGWATLLMYGSVALLGYWLISGGPSAQTALALGSVVALPVFATFFAMRLPFPVPPRYGATALGALLFLLALPHASRPLRGVLVAVAAVSWMIAWRSCSHFLIQDWTPG